MKKLICLILLIITLSLCSCSSEKSDYTNETQQSSAGIKSVETTEFELNNISFCVPTIWKLNNESDSMISFSCDSSENDTIVIMSDSIPDIMKIDTGNENTIISKDDVVKSYGAKMLGTTEISEENWIDNDGIEYCEQYFTMTGKLSTGESDNRLGRSIVIPINQTDAYFSIIMLRSSENTSFSDMDIIIDSITGIESSITSVTPSESTNNTFAAYNSAINMTKADLTKSGSYYYYKGLPLLKDDCEWIDSPINKEGTVNQTAMYMKMAYCIDGFGLGREFGNSWQDYAEILIGFVPSTRQEMIPYIENASDFIIKSDSAYKISKAVMSKFEKLSCTSGDYDYSKNTYNIKINDLSQCAEEMMISEEMLGYIIAAFDAMGAKITFDNNSVSISLVMQ